MAEEINVNELSAAALKEYVKENNLDVEGATTRKEILAVLNRGKETPVAHDPNEVSDIKADADDGAALQAQTDGPVVITGPVGVSPSGNTTSNLNNNNEDGIFTSAAANRKSPVADDEDEPKPAEVALFSERNIHWQGVGELKKGYNVVTERAAEKWLTRNVVREVSARELARHYGK